MGNERSRTNGAPGGVQCAFDLAMRCLRRLPDAVCRAKLTSPGKAAFKFIFATLLVAVAFAATYTSSAAAFSESDMRSILMLGGTVNTVLLLGTLFFLRSRVIANAVLSLIVLASVATTHIIHTDLLTGNGVVLVALCAGAGAGLFVAFRLIDELHWGGAALSVAALFGLGIIADGHLGIGDVPATGDTTNMRDISFRETPNLYFVSFDALAPRALLKKYLALETTKFHDLFDSSFRRFPNFFANTVYTSNSLNMVLALDEDAYSSQQRELKARGADPDPRLFSGQNPSNLLGTLHKNGYETTSIYVDSYFGEEKGKYINNYITFSNKTICSLLDAGIRDFSFWGYCRFGRADWSAALDMSAERVICSDCSHEDRIWSAALDMSAEWVTRVSAKNKPQFVMAHLYAPGHTDKSFRYDDAEQVEKFRAEYIYYSKERAAHYLDLIIRHLEENNPGAILLVYGDHGPFLSKGLQFEDDPEFVFQDHYGILGGVYPRDTCAGWFDEASSQGYMTILDAVHALLRCLSGGESPLINPRKYTQPAQGPIPLDDKPYYEDFLYE